MVALVLSLAAAWLAALAGVGHPAAQPAVSFPREYTTTLVKYAVVDRADGLSRDLYVSPDAIAALRRDPKLSEFPVGTVFAIDVYGARTVGQDPATKTPRFELTPRGRLVRSRSERTLHLMQRTSPGFGSQHWAFAGFDPVTAAPLPLQLPGDCLLCHQAALMSDMTFSLPLLRRFLTTGEVQYRLCPQPGRQACPFQ
ncbi:MAG TPA: cytochrome P460 family protein [Methylomirabilota bacterium]|nr:cytochrome P460 family protein [Methylomirabilota bacterium]